MKHKKTLPREVAFSSYRARIEGDVAAAAVSVCQSLGQCLIWMVSLKHGVVGWWYVVLVVRGDARAQEIG